MIYNQGKLIILEGLDGSGKTHACQLIKYILEKNQIKNIIIHEPGGTPISEKIRNIIKDLHPYEIVHRKTVLLLIYAARMQLIQNVIKPALKNNIWIIADRYELSSFAYQGGGFQIKNKIIMLLKNIIVKSYNPHLTIYLDITPKHALQRIIKRGKLDIIENNNINFFQRVRNSYLNLITKDKNFITINANLKIDVVHQDIKNKFKKWLTIWKTHHIRG